VGRGRVVPVRLAVEKLFELERREGKPPIELRGGLRQLLEERERISAL
jgi:hypothetical protein